MTPYTLETAPEQHVALRYAGITTRMWTLLVWDEYGAWIRGRKLEIHVTYSALMINYEISFDNGKTWRVPCNPEQ